MNRYSVSLKRCIRSCSAGSLAAAALSTALVAAPAQAETYPERTIKIVVAGPPAGGTDYLTRLLADKLTAVVKQTVMVENRAGASGFIGTRYVKDEKNDGYTLLMGHAATNAILPLIRERPTYDAISDFTPISLIATAPEILVVAKDSPIKSIGDYIELAKQKPGEVTYGTPGVGLPQHVLAERFVQQTGVKVLHVPYNGTSPGLNDLVGGRLTSMFVTPGAVMPFIRDGRLRALAVSSEQRSSLLPDVPTFEESGLKGLHQTGWFGIFGPANLPRTVVEKLSNSVATVMADPDVKAQIRKSSLEPVGSGPQEFAAFQAAEVIKFKKIIDELHIKVRD